MRRLLFILALFALPVSAAVPVQQCTNTNSGGTTSCTLTVSAHHLVVAVGFVSGDSHTLSYTDTPGNSFSQAPLPGCITSGCNTGVGIGQSYSISFASWAGVLFYSSTGAFSGSDTFNLSAGGSTPVFLWVGEYGQDLTGVDTGNQGNSPFTSQVTTSGSNDLIISMSGDSGVVTCSGETPASGFTIEFNNHGACLNIADRINLPPGTYTAGTTKTGSAAPGYSTIAFGVAPFVSSAVRHARNLY
jgi:hypothetical protein